MSRTALLVYGIMMFLIFMKSNKKYIFIIAGLSMFFLVTTVVKQKFDIDIIELYSARFFGDGQALETVEDDGRVKIYKESFEILQRNVISGSGISTFSELNTSGFSNAHNIFINVLVERGIIGLLLLLIFIYYIFSINKRALRSFIGHKEEYEFLRLLKIGLIGFFIIGLTGNDLFINSGFINGWATYLLMFLLAIQLKKMNYSKEFKMQHA
jgi:O-antigen ligase